MLLLMVASSVQDQALTRGNATQILAQSIVRWELGKNGANAAKTVKVERRDVREQPRFQTSMEESLVLTKKRKCLATKTHAPNLSRMQLRRALWLWPQFSH